MVMESEEKGGKRNDGGTQRQSSIKDRKEKINKNTDKEKDLQTYFHPHRHAVSVQLTKL